MADSPLTGHPTQRRKKAKVKKDAVDLTTIWNDLQKSTTTAAAGNKPKGAPSFWDLFAGISTGGSPNSNVKPSLPPRITPVAPQSLTPGPGNLNTVQEQQSDLSRQALRDASTTPVSNIAPPAVDPLELIYKQLLANSQMSSSTMSDKDIRKLAEEQIRAQFDPQIKALKQDMAERQQRFNQNKDVVQDLYKDLAAQYQGQGSGAGDAYQDAINQENIQRQSTGQNMNQNYQNSLDYQTQEFNKLGIQDVAQQNFPQQQQDLQYQQTLNNAESDAFNRYAMQNQAADTSYYDKMAKNAGLHGAESVDSLLQELNSYLDTQGLNVSNLRTQSSTSLNQLISQMMQQQQDQQAKIQQENWNRLLQAGQFGTSLANLDISRQKAAVSGANKEPTTGLLGAMNQLSTSSNPTALAGLFQQLLQTQTFKEGKFLSAQNTIIDLTPEQAASEARQFAIQNGLGQQDITAFVNAVLTYYGRLGR